MPCDCEGERAVDMHLVTLGARGKPEWKHTELKMPAMEGKTEEPPMMAQWEH